MKLYFGFSRLTGGMTYWNLGSAVPDILYYKGPLKYIYYSMEYPDSMMSVKKLNKIIKKL